MLKKILCCAITATVLLCSSACSDSAQNASADDKVSVVTTIFPSYDFARQVGGDLVQLDMLVTPGGESHSYEPTPQDIVKVQNCDIFICAGGESDVWSNTILDSIDTGKIKVIKMMDCVEIVEEEIVEGMTAEEEEEGESEPEYDEHVWTSPKNAALISAAISEALISVDSDNEAKYAENAAAYSEKLNALDEEFRNVVNSAPNKTIVVGDRFPFRYLADEYGLTYYAAFPGCSTETDVSASVMAFLVEKINSEKLPAVFYIEFSAMKIANAIAAETGAETLLLHSCHTVSPEDFNNGKTYIDIMKQNVLNLKRGLGQ